MKYSKFFLMLMFSFIIMYSVMYLNVAEEEHIYLSTTRTYMSLLMVLPMAALMMLMMGMMYPDKQRNRTIIVLSIILTGVFIFLLRNQIPIGDKQYMKAMISHHSSAIMTSNNATITDAEVRALADKIIRSQEEEIAQMKKILARMEN